MGQERRRKMVELARVQAGCVSLEQAHDLGVTRSEIRWALQRGTLERLHPRVLHFCDSEVTEFTHTWAAVLCAGPGAVASHEAALWLHGIDRVPYVAAVSGGPRQPHVRSGVRIHRVADLHPEHITVVKGLAVTTVARAIVDLTSVFRRARLADLLDRCTITERRTTIGAVSRTYRQVNRRGRHRIRVLTELLEERTGSHPRPRSLLEPLADDLIVRSGLPQPIHEMPIPTDHERPGLVDRAWPEVQLIVEIDGRPWHARETAMAVDRARDRAAGAVGWQTIRILDEEVVGEADLVVADLAAVYAARCAQLGVQLHRRAC